MQQDIILSSVTIVITLLIVIGLSYFIGKFIYKIFNGQKIFFFSRFFGPIEKLIFKMMGVSMDAQMKPKTYTLHVLAFSFVGFIFLFGLLMLQGYFILNPNHVQGMSWDLALNTAISYITNTNWQAYAGETQLSYLSQVLGLTVQNFVSGAVGICVLFVLVRGLILKESKTVGNFYVDLIRVVLYLLLPLALLSSILLISQGVPQSFAAGSVSQTLDGANANTEQANIFMPLGPAASQISIKQLGTNGGGFFGANSAHPFENPTVFSNLVQTGSILLIPISLCFTFGFAVNQRKQGSMILKVMLSIFVICLVLGVAAEYVGSSVLKTQNFEGKESRFGVGLSAFWAVATTATSNGSVNSTLDSFTPMGGLVLMFLMQLGEIVFGGIGSGLYGMIAFVLLSIFIAGLMIGRTPEYLNKKIDSFDMKMVSSIILPPVLLVLLGTAFTTFIPNINASLTNKGVHGFSEILYAFSSLANNNGSSFAGFDANNLWTNVSGGVIMLITRFVPIMAVIYLGKNFAKKKYVASSAGTLKTDTTMFSIMVFGVILIIGALSFFPAWALGPIGEQVSQRQTMPKIQMNKQTLLSLKVLPLSYLR
ncbi:potassium-transporting ATPase subunit KdpA [[Mycoplasma] testudinis]|uniref:potassium-transporting ATPase subunit KdpA n=1 Tax=[Mycoplasma] testudinis TaxID=33924 RepID=UPI0009FC65ED|nr:potassium-transporting ATPase subunit KdpA [[Mycoplasma] testudinis]